MLALRGRDLTYHFVLALTVLFVSLVVVDHTLFYFNWTLLVCTSVVVDSSTHSLAPIVKLGLICAVEVSEAPAESHRLFKTGIGAPRL